MLTERIGKAAMLEQTAEELCELAQACLKTARDIRGENDTHKRKCEIIDNLHEEMADVDICFSELIESGIVDTDYVGKWRENKLNRMMVRLRDSYDERG